MKWLILSLLLLSMGVHAQAPEKRYVYIGDGYTIQYKLENNLQVISLQGAILSGVIQDLTGFKHVQKLLRKNVDIELNLASGGGYQKLFTQFATSLKRACNLRESGCEITTFVAPFTRCSSACIPLFMVGDVRKASRNSTFGFHQSAVIPGMIKIPGKAQRDLIKTGVDSDWIKKNQRMFDSFDLTYLRYHQMHGSNIITEVID